MDTDFRSKLRGVVASVVSISCYDKFSTAYSDAEVVAGRVPFGTTDNSFLCIGDWRVRSREPHSWGLNKVENEFDILFYTRDPADLADYAIDELLQTGLTLSNLGSATYEVINARLEEAEPQSQFHDNIWRRRFIFAFISIESH